MSEETQNGNIGEASGNVSEAVAAPVEAPAPDAAVAAPEPAVETPAPAEPLAPPITNPYEPIKIQPKISVTIMVGPQTPKVAAGVPLTHLAKPANKTGFISWHDTVYDILGRISEPTDGSLVMLIPGSSYPFQMWDEPYGQLKNGAKVFVVPNTPDQVGPDAVPAVHLP